MRIAISLYACKPGVDNPPPIPTIVYRGAVMKKMLKSAAIVILALVAALGCNKEVEKTEAPPKASQVKQLVLVDLGLCWDWYAVPPDPGEFWEYPSWGSVRAIDVTDWKIGEDVIEISGGPDQRNTFYYPWQGEDTIYHFVTGPYLWVNGKRVGAKLWEVYYGDIPNPEDIVTVIAGTAEVLHFKHLPNLEYAHLIVFSDMINPFAIIQFCIAQPRFFKYYINTYLGWIKLHFLKETPRIYLTTKRLSDIALCKEPPSDYDLARLAGINNIRGWNIGNGEGPITSQGLRCLTRLKHLRELELDLHDLDERSLYHLSQVSSLRRLHLWGEVLDVKGLVHLKQLTNLTELKLSNLALNDSAFAAISRIPNLRRLEIRQYYSDSLEESGLGYLKEAKNLADLRIESRDVTDSALIHLAKLKTLKRLEHQGDR
jgi:hypothetical protein